MSISQKDLIQKAIKIIGLQPLAAACSVTYPAVSGWARKGLPLKCYSEEKDYHHVIERLTNGQVTAADLLAAPRNSNQQ